MLAVFSVADASIVVALITAIATYITTTRNRRDIKQINNAVNHVAPGSPTLIQRVIHLEEQRLKTDTRIAAHTEWEHKAICAIAHQIGVPLPEYPKEETK